MMRNNWQSAKKLTIVQLFPGGMAIYGARASTFLGKINVTDKFRNECAMDEICIQAVWKDREG